MHNPQRSNLLSALFVVNHFYTQKETFPKEFKYLVSEGEKKDTKNMSAEYLDSNFFRGEIFFIVSTRACAKISWRHRPLGMQSLAKICTQKKKGRLLPARAKNGGGGEGRALTRRPRCTKTHPLSSSFCFLQCNKCNNVTMQSNQCNVM